MRRESSSRRQAGVVPNEPRDTREHAIAATADGQVGFRRRLPTGRRTTGPVPRGYREEAPRNRDCTKTPLATDASWRDGTQRQKTVQHGREPSCRPTALRHCGPTALRLDPQAPPGAHDRACHFTELNLSLPQVVSCVGRPHPSPNAPIRSQSIPS